jgi:hypothetical protein
MNEMPTDFKILILARYCGQFQPATKNTATAKKTSQDIVIDLRPMIDLTANQVSEYMVLSGYEIGFDDNEPHWLMQEVKTKELAQ